MKLKVFLSWVILSALLSGCSGVLTHKEYYYKYGQKDLLKQASFDLDCPANKIKDQVLADTYRSVGVKGCGKRAQYKRVNGVGWVANTMSH